MTNEQIVQEIKRKALLGIPLSHVTDEKMKLYNQFKSQEYVTPTQVQQPTPQVTTGSGGSNLLTIGLVGLLALLIFK